MDKFRNSTFNSVLNQAIILTTLIPIVFGACNFHQTIIALEVDLTCVNMSWTTIKGNIVRVVKTVRNRFNLYAPKVTI